MALMLVVLNACVSTATTLVPDQSRELWDLRQQNLARIDHWDLRGRVALYINNEVHSVGLNWTRTPAHSTISLEAPLSQGMVKLETTAALVTLTTSEGKTYTGHDAEQVLFQSTGWSIPVEGLTTWITGINHMKSDYMPDIDASGKAISLNQDNWRINYLNYAPSQLIAYNNPELPQKIYMKHDQLALKIVIDQWQNPNTPTSSELFPRFPE